MNCFIECQGNICGGINLLKQENENYPTHVTSQLLTFALFVFFQNVFNKPKGTNSSATPPSQGQVVVSPPSGSAVSAAGGNASATSGSSPIGSISSSASGTAGFRPLAAPSQQVAVARTLVKLKCQHCSHLFATKPELLFYKVKRNHERDGI